MGGGLRRVNQNENQLVESITLEENKTKKSQRKRGKIKRILTNCPGSETSLVFSSTRLVVLLVGRVSRSFSHLEIESVACDSSPIRRLIKGTVRIFLLPHCLVLFQVIARLVI